jgi:hypothetical protein
MLPGFSWYENHQAGPPRYALQMTIGTLIWLSVNYDFFMQNFLASKVRKFYLRRLPFCGGITLCKSTQRSSGSWSMRRLSVCERRHHADACSEARSPGLAARRGRARVYRADLLAHHLPDRIDVRHRPSAHGHVPWLRRARASCRRCSNLRKAPSSGGRNCVAPR